MRTKQNHTMLCDFYELTMANGYYKLGKGQEIAYFDVFFRQIPDGGGFAIAAGLEQVIEYIRSLEFTDEDISGAKMDVLTGYARDRGAKIALRTLSPQVLAMDEIGAEGDVRAFQDVMRAGVYLLASAHAKNMDDIQNRPLLSQILKSGVFDCALLLSREGGRLSYSLCRL